MLRSRPKGPQIRNVPAKKSVAGHVEEGMGHVTVGK